MESASLKGQDGALALGDFRRSGAEQRREPRIAASKALWVYRPHGEVLIGDLTDCAPHGVGLLVPQIMKEGEQLGLKMWVERLHLLSYTVRYCRPHNGRYKVGALLCSVDGGDAGDEELEAIFRALLQATTLP